MNGVSFFAGIGGFDLGFEWAGIDVVCQIERDPFCQKILAKHWPHVTRYGDINNVGKNRQYQLPKADIFFGGFPCQPHSTAGKRKGAADDRDLWPEYFRVISEYRPAWVVSENVPGIRTTILDQVLFDLESLDYAAVPLAIPAAGFNAPHIRERIFIIAYAGRVGGDGNAADANSVGHKPERLLRKKQEVVRGNWWQTEPGVCGVADGVPDRLDRIRTLGNAVVPQEAEFIGRLIMKANQFTN